MNQRLPLAARPQKRAAAGRKKPLVAIAGVPVGANGGDVEFDLPGGVRAVDQYKDAAPAR